MAVPVRAEARVVVVQAALAQARVQVRVRDLVVMAAPHRQGPPARLRLR